MRNIQALIKKEYEALSKDFTVFGVFLYGSQNYGLSTEESDVDTKAIVIPSLHDLVFRPPISKVVSFEWGECDVKDIRGMIKNYKKQNVNFIETMFTEYKYISPAFETEYEQLISKREEIAHLDEQKTLACMQGLLLQSIKRMSNMTDSTAADIEKYGYHRKSLMNAYKMNAMIKKYTDGCSYPAVLENSEFADVRTKALSKDFAFGVASTLDKKACDLSKAYLESRKPKPDEDLIEWLDGWMYRLIQTQTR